jgi:hypothetical protein
MHPEADLNVNLGSYQSDERSSPPFAGSEALIPTHWEDESPFRTNCPLVPGGISSWWSGGMHPGDKESDNSSSLQSQTSPQEMLQEFAS